MKRAIVTVSNDIENDQRVQRICAVLADNGYQVTVTGRYRKWSKKIPHLPFQVKRFRLFFNRKSPFYAELNTRLFFYLLFRKADLIYANDLDTLLPAYLVAELKGIPLIYDSHEYYCHTPELESRPQIQAVWLKIEGMILPRLKYMITVNNSIAGRYTTEYGIKPAVVRNVSWGERAAKALEKRPSRESLGLPEGPFFIMQGTGINIDRGAEEAIEAVSLLQAVSLVFLGGGDAWQKLQKMTQDLGLENRVFFLERKPYSEMIASASYAEGGLSLDKPSNPNYRLSLPNKIFDYIHAGIPVIASPLHEVKKIVDGFDIGVTIPSHQSSDIARAMDVMMNDTTLRDTWKTNLQTAAAELRWEIERKVLDDIIRETEHD